MSLDELSRIASRYLNQLDEEYKRAVESELEAYARELIGRRIESLEPLRRKITELFQA